MLGGHGVQRSVLENIVKSTCLFSVILKETYTSCFFLTVDSQVRDGPDTRLSALESTGTALQPSVGDGKTLQP